MVLLELGGRFESDAEPFPSNSRSSVFGGVENQSIHISTAKKRYRYDSAINERTIASDLPAIDAMWLNRFRTESYRFAHRRNRNRCWDAGEGVKGATAIMLTED